MLPKGWDFAAVFGHRAEMRAQRLDQLPSNVLKAINARDTRDAPQDDTKTLDLPQTATAWEMTLAFGLTLLLFGAALLRTGRSAIGFRGRVPSSPRNGPCDPVRATSKRKGA
jgi:hypothetical protein